MNKKAPRQSMANFCFEFLHETTYVWEAIKKKKKGFFWFPDTS